jgi:hypothetical protein
MTFDPSAQITIFHANRLLHMNPATRDLLASMTTKPSVIARFGRYVVTHGHPYARTGMLEELTRPHALHLDGREVIYGSNNLQAFENEVLGFLGQETKAA